MFDYGACVCSCGVFAYALNDKISKCLKYNSNVNKVNVIMEQWHLQKKNSLIVWRFTQAWNGCE